MTTTPVESLTKLLVYIADSERDSYEMWPEEERENHIFAHAMRVAREFGIPLDA